MVNGKTTTMMCALLAALLVIIGSVLVPPVSAPAVSSAEAPLHALSVGSVSPVEPHSHGDPPAEVRSDAFSPALEVLSAIATPVLPADFAAQEADQGLHPLEAQLLGLLNDERIQRGLNPLQVDDRLVLLARERSSDMASRNYFSHVTPEGEMVFQAMDARGVAYFLAGENLARNRFPLAESAEVAHDGFMNSPAHRENELEPTFDRVGIGVAFSESGTIYFTELFIAVRQETSTAY